MGWGRPEGPKQSRKLLIEADQEKKGGGGQGKAMSLNLLICEMEIRTVCED